MNPVQNISTPAVLPGQAALGRTETAQPGASFKDFLLESIREVNSMQQAADRAVEALSTGQDVNPAEVLTAVQKADIAFRLMMQIRNKIVQAYQEVQNIRV
ncbi:MAG TPA: flagellar hook-basal body complex protein FliE [Thermoguttaceae bacterium]|nr:flagellar hook-basal body complex protein FliE [Thermoguttaceae bacterium]